MLHLIDKRHRVGEQYNRYTYYIFGALQAAIDKMELFAVQSESPCTGDGLLHQLWLWWLLVGDSDFPAHGVLWGKLAAQALPAFEPA